MTDRNDNLSRSQLDDALRPYAAVGSAPRRGWVRAIREALGMTQGQLGERLTISRQSVQDLERAEAGRRITLDSLDRLAQAMGCRVVYALVPQGGSLGKLREARALELANTLLKPAAHSMKLEAQGVSPREQERQRKLLAGQLLSGSARKLWR